MVQRITHITIAIFCFLFPLFFLPFTADTHEYAKLILLLSVDTILMLLISFRYVQEKKFVVSASSFTLPLLAFVAATAMSTLFQSANPFLALTSPLSFSTILGMGALYLLLSQEISKTNEGLLLKPLGLATGLVSIYCIAMWLKILPFSVFTPAGNLLATGMYLTIIGTYLLAALIQKLLHPPLVRRISIGLLLCIIGAAGIMTSFLFTSHRPIVLPFSVGMDIASSIFRHPRTALLGVGMGNFQSAYTMEKPLSFNQSQYWNISFTSSSSYVLTLLTEGGTVATLVYVTIFFIAIYRCLASRQPASFALIVAMLFQLVLPSNMTISILIVILLILSGKTYQTEVPIARTGTLRFLPSICLLIIASLILYAVIRSYLAELYFFQSLSAMNEGKGNTAYDLQKLTLRMNPGIDRYYVAFSQTNLVLANTIAAEASPSPKAKELIPSLIQQSLDAGKSATAHNPTSAPNWIHLGSLYTSLIGFAEESDRWAIESYEKASLLDPHNALIHVGMAAVYQKTDRFNEAESHLRTALQLKPDLTSASVFLAKQQKELGKSGEAKKTLEEAQLRVPPGSQEYILIEEELKKLVSE